MFSQMESRLWHSPRHEDCIVGFYRMSNRTPEFELKLALAELRDLIEDAHHEPEQLPASSAHEVLKLHKRITKLELEIWRLESD